MTNTVVSYVRRFSACLTIVAAIAASPCSLASAQPNPRAQRQRGIHWILTGMEARTVADLRANCVAGDPAFGSPMLVNATAAGFSLSAVELCITVLTREGRDGGLAYLRLNSGAVTPAISLDTGFVTAWRKRESTEGLPVMAALKPVAERCLAQTERDTDLCRAVGYAYGTRAANGEVIGA